MVYYFSSMLGWIPKESLDITAGVLLQAGG